MVYLAMKVRCASKARILRIPVKAFLVGQKFDAIIRITNIRNEAFPGGVQTLSIRWPNNQSFTLQHEIPRLTPNETYETSIPDLDVLASGYISFFSNISTTDGERVGFTSGNGPMLDEGCAVHSVTAKTPEEIYQYWAMLFTAFGFLVLVVEKVLSFIISFFR